MRLGMFSLISGMSIWMLVPGCEGAATRDGGRAGPAARTQDGAAIDAAKALPVGPTDGVRGFVPINAGHRAFQIDLVETAGLDPEALPWARLSFVTEAGSFPVEASPRVEAWTLVFDLEPDELPPPGLGHFELEVDGAQVSSTDSIYFVFPGDTDQDMEFRTGDLVAAQAAGKYELDEPATWAEGDWDGDGRFTSSDFVAALAQSAYEAGPLIDRDAIDLQPSLHWNGDMASDDDDASFRAAGATCEMTCGLVTKSFYDLAAGTDPAEIEALLETYGDDPDHLGWLEAQVAAAVEHPHSGQVQMTGGDGMGCAPTWTTPPVGAPENHVSGTFNWCSGGDSANPDMREGGVTGTYDCVAEKHAALQCVVHRTGVDGPAGHEPDPCQGASASALLDVDIDLHVGTGATLDWDAYYGENADTRATSKITTSLFRTSALANPAGALVLESTSRADGTEMGCLNFENVGVYAKAFCRAVVGGALGKDGFGPKLEAFCAIEGGAQVSVSLEQLAQCIASNGLESHGTARLIDDGIETSVQIPAGGVVDLGYSRVDYHTEYEIDRPLAIIDVIPGYPPTVERAYQNATANVGAHGEVVATATSYVPTGISEGVEIRSAMSGRGRPRLVSHREPDGSTRMRVYFERYGQSLRLSCPEPKL